MHQHAQWVIAIAQHQDRQAFIALFGHYAPRVKSYLLSAGAELEQVDEIVQEVMLTIWRRAGSYRPEKAAVSTWIFTIARNRRIDRFRKTRRLDLDPADPHLHPSSAAAPDDATAANRRQQALREALGTLPKEQAVIVHRAYFEGASRSEIARELGLPLGTVKSRIRLAMERLRDVMESQP